MKTEEEEGKLTTSVSFMDADKSEGIITPLAKSVSSLFQKTAEAEVDLKKKARMQYGADAGVKGRLQSYFLENTKSSLRIRLFNFIIKIVSCVLYCVRVVQDSRQLPEDVKINPESRIHYEYIFYVDTSNLLWTLQTSVAIISILETVLIFYLTYKGSLVQLLFNLHFLLELITSFPLVVTIFVPEWRFYYVPIFLNCWLAHAILEDMLHDLHRVSQVSHSALFRQMIGLFSTLICLIFSGACGMEHLQRSGEKQMDLFTSFYFVMVTFSTVGYGDYHPDWWMSQLYVVILIGVALAILPSKVSFSAMALKVYFLYFPIF
uniref:Potassium channel domain-containing protein n=1 Tax=Panagrolaimus sp. JU765 TaxID=591449 RepID=A0AC34RS35_9BILA